MGSRKFNQPFIMFDMDGTLNKWRWLPLEVVKQPGYFRSVSPQVNVIEAARRLNEKFLVGTYSAAWLDDGHSVEDKQFWMDQYVSFIPRQKRFFVPCGTNKADYFEMLVGRPLSRFDILIDDNSDVLRAWQEAGGLSCKVYSESNGHFGTWKGPSFSAYDKPSEIASYILATQLSVVGALEEKSFA